MEDAGRRLSANGWAWCALAAVLFGAATPATKLVVDQVGAVALAGLLYLGAAAAVAPLALREQRPTTTVRQRSRLLIAVAVGGGRAPVLLVLALDRTPAGTVSLFLNLELVATAVTVRIRSPERSPIRLDDDRADRYWFASPSVHSDIGVVCFLRSSS